MAHYALINEQNVVTLVFVGRDETERDWESYYSTDTQRCLRTSYNTLGGQHLNGGQPFRKNFAGEGFIYDQQLDAFIPPKPWPSWTLNQTTCLWEPPIPAPDDDQWYSWDEPNQRWVAL